MYYPIFMLTLVILISESYQFVETINEGSYDIEEENRATKQQFIVPGTKWCGQGNRSDNENDLGLLKEVDKCCRSHDLCPDIIPAYQSKYNLTNPTFYTRLSCDCENDFRHCLKEVKGLLKGIISSKIGIFYFSYMRNRCFKKDHPIKKCDKFNPILNKCNHYDLDRSKDKVYQFFDVPNYY